MRVDPHIVGSIMHTTQRGTRGMKIAKDNRDKTRFARSLFLLNDEHSDSNWLKATSQLPLFERPSYWPERRPLTRILAWTLMPNHFHLLMQEIKDGGIAKFMQRLCGSMSTAYNNKYNEKGSLFQGGYKGKIVSDDNHFLYLPFYILVKNVLEMYPGGLVAASKSFNSAWQWATEYQFSSFGSIIRGGQHSIIDDPEKRISKFLEDEARFKEESRELLAFHMAARGEKFENIMLEKW